jgi:predicted permease
MTVLNVAYNVVLPVFLVMGLGALASRRVHIEPRTLSSLIIYIFSPALVLDGISTSALQAGEIGRIFATAIGLAIIMAGLSYGIARLAGFDRRLQSAFMMTAILINAGNYGLPLNEFAFGQVGLDRAMIYYVMTAVVANTFGVFLASRGEASAKESFLNVFRVPLVYGLIVGLALNFGGVALPAPIARATHLVGQAAVPGMLIMLGLQLARVSFKGQLKPILMASGLRLVAAPIITVGLAALFGLTGVTRSVSIVESAMPTAVITSVLAAEFNADGEFVAGVILVSTLASLLTLSVLLSLLGVG